MNKLVIFDLDGTLLDTLADIYENINIMLDKFGYPLKTIEQIRQYIGNGAKKLVERSLPDTATESDILECLAFYNDVYTNCGSPKTKLYDGVGEVLLQLKDRGFKLAILTNKPQPTTNEVYKKYLAEYNFDMVVGQSFGKKIKPDPETTLEIMNKLGAGRKSTYFIGDGETDIQVANNARVNGVAVLWGFRDKEQLSNAGAKVFATEPKQLLSIIK
ncbi:MAG: HAD family hydrolase [Clostridia bacterium]|nr:HAD family hydrolase [Clostridia bacterium]